MKLFSPSNHRRKVPGFSLIEMLITLFIIGVISSVVVISMSNTSRDVGRNVGRQQQAAINSAVQQWIAAQMRDPTTGRVRSISTIRATYNSYATSMAKLQAISAYISDTTIEHFETYTTNSDQLKSEGLQNANGYISLPAWSATEDSPSVNLTY